MTCRLLALALLVGCASNAMTIDEYPCPPEGTDLTYENFGAQFVDVWCMRCHDEGPNGIYLDDREDIFRRRDRIFVNAAATNTYMPPGPDDPGAEERDLLAEWLACGAP
jgi:hypothetical protein